MPLSATIQMGVSKMTFRPYNLARHLPKVYHNWEIMSNPTELRQNVVMSEFD